MLVRFSLMERKARLLLAVLLLSSPYMLLLISLHRSNSKAEVQPTNLISLPSRVLSLIGKGFVQIDSCQTFRGGSDRFVNVTSNAIIFGPWWYYRQRGSVGIWMCRESFELHFAQNNRFPFIRHYLPVDGSNYKRSVPHSTVHEEMDEQCKTLQKHKDLYMCEKHTAWEFFDAIRVMTNEIVQMRDHVCVESLDGGAPEPGKPNRTTEYPVPELGAIVSYLVPILLAPQESGIFSIPMCKMLRV